MFRENLRDHRLFTVRRECRLTHLAYGFLRGRAYRQLESYSRTKLDWGRVERMVMRYGMSTELGWPRKEGIKPPSNPEMKEAFEKWKTSSERSP